MYWSRTPVPGTVPPILSPRPSPCTWTTSSYTDKTTALSPSEVTCTIGRQSKRAAFDDCISKLSFVGTAAEERPREEAASAVSTQSPFYEASNSVCRVSKATQTQAPSRSPTREKVSSAALRFPMENAKFSSGCGCLISCWSQKMSQKASFEFLPEIVECFSEPGCETGVFTV